LVTRSQVESAALRLYKNRDNNSKGWAFNIDGQTFFRKEILDIVVNLAGTVSALLRLNNKSNVALAIDSIVASTVKSPEPSNILALNDKLTELKNQLRYVRNVDSAEYVRIDAQIDLLVELLERETNVQKAHHKRKL
jgi:hypothetical protein